MDLLQRAKLLLSLYEFHPKRRLGQNFVVDSTFLRKMISYASIGESDVVLEVGAGLGFLTNLLSRECKRVIAVEMDPKLMRILREQLDGLQNVDLIEGDILNVSVPFFNKVVSTPPYSISSPFLFWLLENKFDCAVLTFQKEFADRLGASVGSKDYGRLTVTTYYRAEVDLLDSMPRNVFYPQPDVDSVVVQIRPRKPPFQVEDKETFLELIRILFTQRNKKVKNAIIRFFYMQGICERNAAGLANSLSFNDKRVRGLAPEDFGTLANEIIRKHLAPSHTKEV